MSEDVINTWDNVQNTSCWVHDSSQWEIDGVVERSAVDIVALAGTVQVYASNASASADNAQSWAENASATAAGISGYVDAASGYADNASSYADTASGYIATTSDYMTSAGGYATNASNYAGNAYDYMSSAGGYVTSASSYADTASGYVNTASGYMVSAGGYVMSASGYAGDAAAYAASAGGYVTAASGYADTAGGYVTSASGYADTASAWAASAGATLSNCVTLTGDQSISGTKTFSSTISGTITSATDASSLGGVAASGYVTTSGDQTISGNKTIVDNLRFNKTATINGVSTNHSATLSMNGTSLNVGFYDISSSGWVIAGSPNGTTFTDNAFLAQSGATIKNGATISGGLTVTSGATISGGMTVDGKGLVYTTTNQQIEGEKTFGGTVTLTQSPKIQRINPYLDFVETDWEKGGDTSVTTYQGLRFHDKNENEGGAIYYNYYSNKNCEIAITARDMHTSSATGIFAVNLRYAADGNMFFMPNNANVYLGYSGNNRWKQLYATTTTIATSDERQKTSISVVPDAVLDAWGDVQWSQFQMRDAVAEKGENARLHNGLIAQRIDAVFNAHGLDASRYGLFCHDVWGAEPEERDPEGKLVREARPAGDEYSLRYEEALAMEAAYQRRRADRAEARITALEQRLNEMEAVLASLISPVGEEQTADAQEGKGADA